MRTILVLVLASSLLPVLVLVGAPGPVFLTLLGWVAACGVLLFRATGRPRLLWFYGGVLCLCLAVLEVVAGISLARRDVHYDRPLSEGYARTDEVLGYAPVPGSVRRVRKHAYGELLYEVTYRIDSAGLRAVPGEPPAGASGCVLFFGGSYTFGEGVEDDEAFPAIVQPLSGVPTRNFGFHGYGPHQMYAAIESGRVEEALECEPRLAIYTASVPHLNRAAGRSSWDRHGPRYVLDARGRPERRGHFDDGPGLVSDLWRRLRGKSWFYRRYVMDRDRATEEDIPLFLALVSASREALRERYPGLGFEVVL